MTNKLAAGVILLTAIACAPVPPPVGEESVPVHGSGGRVCNSAAVQHLQGRERSSEVGSEALRLSGAGGLRWIRPGDAVTMDYREDRLNVELDARGRVAALRCG